MSDEEIRKKWQGNLMLKPRIEKVTVNMSVGKSGEPLERAAKVLEIYEGTKEIEKLIIARCVLGRY